MAPRMAFVRGGFGRIISGIGPFIYLAKMSGLGLRDFGELSEGVLHHHHLGRRLLRRFQHIVWVASHLQSFLKILSGKVRRIDTVHSTPTKRQPHSEEGLGTYHSFIAVRLSCSQCSGLENLRIAADIVYVGNIDAAMRVTVPLSSSSPHLQRLLGG